MNSVPNSNSTPGKVGNSSSGAVPNSQSHISQPSYSGTNPYDIPPTWCFSKEELEEMPSLKEGMTQESEQQMRQQAAVFIQDMAEKLNSNVKDTRGKITRNCITRNCMCVAMVHLHRFFVIHSMKMFDPRDVAAACLFLAGKGEECPRKLDHIVNVWFRLKNKIDRPFVLEAKVAQQESEYIVLLESIVLQTIGFILQVELPHPLILTAMTNLAKSSPSSRSLMETAYYFATDILLITDWCIRYTMRTLACVCIQLTCIWAEFKIPPAASNFKPWYQTVDPDLSEELLLALTDQFTVICANSDKSHVFRKRQQASAGKMRSGIQPPLPTGPQTPSSSKILPPPPPPPTLTPESGSEASTAKRRIEESPDATLAKKVVKTETRERIHVMKKPDPIVSPKQEVVVDEWVAQASVLNMKDEPRKEKKKLALSEYRERRKEAASAFSNEAHSASSAEHHLSDGTTSETEQSAGSSASINVKVEIKTEMEKGPEQPRRSFIPDMNTASELVESMELPIGIPMVKTEAKKEKSASEKEREKRKREEDSSRRRRHEEKHSRDSSQHSRDASSHHHKSSSRPPSNLNQTLPDQQGQKYEKLAKSTVPQPTGSSQPQPQAYRSLTPNMPSGQMASGQKTVPQTSGLSQPMRELSSGYNQAATRPQPQVQQTGWSSPPSPVFESISPSDSPAVPRPPVPQAYSQTRMPLPAASSSMSAQSNSWRPAKPYKQSQSQQSSQRSSQNSAGGQELEEGELD